VTAEEASTRALHVGTPSGGYEVVIADGILDRVAERCREVAGAHRYAVIADSQVARLYGARVRRAFDEAGETVDLLVFPAGEWNKTREQWALLSDRLLELGLGRDAAIVALGGGVAGDLGGFVAATYMRGIPVIQVPTTLLAMLDSSVGGKTGVDTGGGKNLVGAFHHPSLVLIDPRVLETLPRHQRAAGLAEAIKTAAILDVRLWEWIEDHAEGLIGGEPGLLSSLVGRVVRHKIDVVAADPLETDRRAILNFGHTIGHALEALEGFSLLHGEAVAAGMRVETRLGERLGVTARGTSERLSALLEACELDREWEAERSPADVLEALSRDKKTLEARLRCVFLREIGRTATDPTGRHTLQIDPAALEASLPPALRPGSED
jgi:3-dehydroquinate synthase